jgi:transcriptional regulator with XRE-family HTH domain
VDELARIARSTPWSTHPGVLLRAMRRRRRLSQRDLAAIAGVARSNVARIESGESMPRLDTFARLVDAASHALLLVDHRGRALDFDRQHEALVDRAGRHFPAHADAVETGDLEPSWWWGWYSIAWGESWETVPSHVQRRPRRPRRYQGSRWGPRPYAHPWVLPEIT